MDQDARVNEIFELHLVWMFLKINFQFEIMNLCGKEIFQHIFSINSPKYSEKPLLHSAILISDPTLVPTEMYPLLLSISIDQIF